MEFKKIDLDDISIIKPYLLNQTYQSCDYTLGVLFMWNDYFKYHYCIIDETLVIYFIDKNKLQFLYPIGKNVNKALDFIKEYCEENNLDLRFGCVEEKATIALKDYFNSSKIDVMYEEDLSDYVYDYDRLSTLIGKKQSKHRNHVNKFRSLYENRKVVRITNENVHRVLEFLKQYPLPRFEDEMANYEIKMISRLLLNLDLIDQVGYFVEVNDKIVAFSTGEVIGDTLYVHVEKALKEYEGSFAYMNQIYARQFKNFGLKFINREEDLGDLGLRKAKTSYHPEKMIKKSSVIIS
jgi:hypothetical protein